MPAPRKAASALCVPRRRTNITRNASALLEQFHRTPLQHRRLYQRRHALCIRASIDTDSGSHNARYVNPFVRGFPRPAGFRYSSTMARGFEITSFVAKLGPTARYFERISSCHGDDCRNARGLTPIGRADASEKRSPARRWVRISNLALAWGSAWVMRPPDAPTPAGWPHQSGPETLLAPIRQPASTLRNRRTW